jgi:nucleoside triphosphate diphosphatase
VADSAARNAEAIERLDEITRRLRRECPWDREQDERSIVPHTVEEAYELADAAGRGDDGRLLDELGDVLFQVHFLALLLEERGSGDLAAVADGCREKLIRRHPHVFGAQSGKSAQLIAGDRPETPDQVRGNWDRIKREVESGGSEPFAGVPENLPALLYARKLQRRAESAGYEEAQTADAARILREAADDLAGLLEQGESGGPGAEPHERRRVETAVGELLFAAVSAARRLQADPELALRARAGRLAELKDSSAS